MTPRSRMRGFKLAIMHKLMSDINKSTVPHFGNLTRILEIKLRNKSGLLDLFKVQWKDEK